MTLARILYALGDPMRLHLIDQLMDTREEVSCGTLHLGDQVAKSTGSHLFKVLREAGLIRMVPQGRRLLISLRREDLEEKFPGLLDKVVEIHRKALVSPAKDPHTGAGVPS